jgi:diguanylate cyclase (GGDEF)-like protein
MMWSELLLGPPALDDHTRFRYQALSILSLLGIVGGIAMTFMDYDQGRRVIALADGVAVCLFSLNLVYLYRKRNMTVASALGFAILLALILFSFLIAGAPTLFWLYMFPWLAFFLFGLRVGTILNLVLAVLFLYMVNHLADEGAIASNLRGDITASYFMLMIIAFTYEYLKVKQEHKLELVSRTDSLTGALNRYRFDVILNHEIERARRYETPLGVIMLDLDNFKRINDDYGHRIGDVVLQELVLLVRRRIRRTDEIIRYGGEEFIVVTPMTNMDQARELAEDIRATADAHRFPGVASITVSTGVTAFKPGDDMDSLLSRVDAAMYEAKRLGRNRVEVIA